MKAVLRSILRARQRHATLPLYEFMRDESIPARCRLSFYPCVGLVVIALDDLAKHVLRDERSCEKYQEAVNAHCWEGDSRLGWYLADLANLGFDRETSIGAAQGSLFGDATRVGRLLGIKLGHLVYGASPVERLVIIEAIEAAGGLLFRLMAQLANELRADHGPELRRLGGFDLCRDPGNGVGKSRIELLREISLEPVGRARCMTHVERVFYLFREWTAELLAFAVTRRDDEHDDVRALDEEECTDDTWSAPPWYSHVMLDLEPRGADAVHQATNSDPEAVRRDPPVVGGWTSL